MGGEILFLPPPIIKGLNGSILISFTFAVVFIKLHERKSLNSRKGVAIRSPITKIALKTRPNSPFWVSIFLNMGFFSLLAPSALYAPAKVTNEPNAFPAQRNASLIAPKGTFIRPLMGINSLVTFRVCL